MDLPSLRITPVAFDDSSLLRARGMKKSPSSWKLASLSSADEDDALSATDSEEETPEADRKRSRTRSLCLAKPPRHKSMPTCVQSTLNVWKRVLGRDDVSVLSDFFHDMGGSDAQAWELVQQMQFIGVSITIQQFYALRRCCVYSVLLTVL